MKLTCVNTWIKVGHVSVYLRDESWSLLSVEIMLIN